MERMLDSEEHARMRRFYFKRHRRIFVAAHVLLRLALSKQYGIPATDWRYARSYAGKPVIANMPQDIDLRFSLSRTGGMVAVALAEGVEIGIDVEEVDSGCDVMKLANAFFAPEEAVALNSLFADASACCTQFFALWTLKEAFVKACGRGLGQPLNSFVFSVDPIRLTLHDLKLKAVGTWHFAQWQPTARHFLALAIDWLDSKPPIVHRRVINNLSDLVAIAGIST